MTSRHRIRHRLGVAAILAVAYASWGRPRLLRWGATDEEVARTYPGDELVADPNGGATMATTLQASPETVWSWLVQMGGDRAGWYSFDRIDNNGRPSARRILPALQQLHTGQQLARAPKGPANCFTVAEVVPNHRLVLQSTYGLVTGVGYDPQSGPRPWTYTNGTWAFYLRPVSDGTRLVTRSRSRGEPPWFARLFGLLIGEPVHFAMQTRQLHNLRVRMPPLKRGARGTGFTIDDGSAGGRGPEPKVRIALLRDDERTAHRDMLS